MGVCAHRNTKEQFKFKKYSRHEGLEDKFIYKVEINENGSWGNYISTPYIETSSGDIVPVYGDYIVYYESGKKVFTEKDFHARFRIIKKNEDYYLSCSNFLCDECEDRECRNSVVRYGIIQCFERIK